MFDYQAGEKYKLTLVMVALAGLMAGMFFALLILPTPEAPHHRQRPAYANDPDITGQARSAVPQGAAQEAAQDPNQAAPDGQEAAQAAPTADPIASLNLVQQWLPLAWDLSAGSAQTSQARAIQYMTPDCAAAYRRNIWTDDVARQIDEAGIRSSFTASRVAAGGNQPDGSIIITVEGQQVLSVPGKGSKARQVKLEYLIKITPDGLRIAGISEGGKRS